MKGLMKLPMSLFRVLDTETNEIWTANNGKSVWLMIGHAKASWTQRNWRDKTKFNDQSRFVIVKYTTEKWIEEILE